MRQDLEIRVENLRGRPDLQEFLLHRVKGMNRQKLENLLHRKHVLLNGIPATHGTLLSNGDLIVLKEQFTSKIHVFAENIPLEIIFENSDFIIINKPTGMSCHAGLGNYKGTLLNALKYYFESRKENALENGLVHRLDKETSGLILVAKSKHVFGDFSAMFRNKQVQRYYDAVCHGSIEENSFTVNVNLGRDKINPAIIRYFENSMEGKEAITAFKVINRSASKTLVECKPLTGRTHQIRLHLLYKGFPIIGDRRYSDRNETGAKRMFLHAKRIEFEYKEETFSFTVPSGFEAELKV